MSIFQQIKSSLEIASEIERITSGNLHGNGKRRSMKECPLCQHKNCFSVDIDKQNFTCYSTSCGEHGDIIDFVKAYENLGSKWEAVKRLAAHLGIDIAKKNGALKEDKSEATKETIFNVAAEFYHQSLLKNEKAISELARKRKYGVNEIKMFKLGYSGDDWNTLRHHLKDKGFSQADMLNSGLVVDRGEAGKLKLGDYFPPQRFIYPAFIGRQVVDFEGKDAFRDARTDEEKKKWPKSKNLKIEHRLRSKLFYNQRAFSYETVILVEGKDDCIQTIRAQGMADGKYQFDEKNWRIPNVKMNVAAFDGKPSEEQKRYIREKCKGKTIYIFPDQDEKPKDHPASKEWKNPGLEYVKLVFFLTWGVADQCQVIALNRKREGKDPDDYFCKMHPSQGHKFRNLMNTSKDAFQYLMRYAVKTSPDNAKQIKLLDPYIQKLIGVKDQIWVELGLDALKTKFHSDDSSIYRIAADQVKRGRQVKDLSKFQDRLPIWEEDGLYKFRDPNRGNTDRLSNFKVLLEDRIFHEEIFKYKCTLLSSTGERAEEVIFDPKQRSNLNAFKEVLAAAGPFYFYGGPNQLSYLWEFVDRHQTSERTIYVQGVGWIKKQNMFLFGNGAVKNGKPYQQNEKELISIEGTNYKSSGVYVYGGELPELNFTDEYSPEFANEVAQNFIKMVEVKGTGDKDYKGLFFLGFLPAVLYSHHIVDFLKMFPFPFWYGTPGTGKSAAIELMMNCIGYSGTAEPFAELTSAGFCQAMEQVSSLIYWTTEFKREKFADLEETFKSAYHRNPPGKGGMQKKRLNYILNGCNFIDGNQLPVESDAMMERIVTFSLFRKPEPGSSREEAFNWLHKHKKRLSTITRQILIDQTPDTVVELKKRIGEYRHFLTSEYRFDLRTAKNYAIPAAALHLIRGIEIPEDFNKWLGEYITNNREYNIKGDPVINFFQRLGYLYIDKGLLKSAIAFENLVEFEGTYHEGDFLFINLQSAFLEIQEDMGKKRENVNFSRNYIFDALKNSDAYLGHNINKRIDKRQGKCMLLKTDCLHPVIQSELGLIQTTYFEKHYSSENE